MNASKSKSTECPDTLYNDCMNLHFIKSIQYKAGLFKMCVCQMVDVVFVHLSSGASSLYVVAGSFEIGFL